ncbi:hypothetical protein FOZ63_009999, partial [Perkinsus olseni]
SPDTPELAPRMSGETLVELWDAPIEETLPDSKLAKEIVASRTSPVFSPKMGHVRILARPHSSTESTTQSPPMSTGAKSPTAEPPPPTATEEEARPSSPGDSPAVNNDSTEIVPPTDVSLRESSGSKVIASRKLPVTKLKSDRDRPSKEEQKKSEVDDTSAPAASTKPRRHRKGKGKGGGSRRQDRHYKQWNYNSYYYYY